MCDYGKSATNLVLVFCKNNQQVHFMLSYSSLHHDYNLV